MVSKSLGNPYDGGTDLRHGAACTCTSCKSGKQHHHHDEATAPAFDTPSSEDLMARAVESAVVRSIFGHNELSRRSFAKMIGGSTLAAAIASVFPMDAAKAAIADTLGKPEKSKLKVGFVPITCATPIIMAKPLGFYEKYGLDVDVIKTAGWAAQ
jgi:nitrate/nitrite transport system substrate-binding protein